MIKKICKIIRHMFTETDNLTADLGAVLFAIVIISYTVCGVYSVFWLKQPFDWQAAGVGAGAVLTAAGVMFACKKPSQSDGDGD